MQYLTLLCYNFFAFFRILRSANQTETLKHADQNSQILPHENGKTEDQKQSKAVKGKRGKGIPLGGMQDCDYASQSRPRGLISKQKEQKKGGNLLGKNPSFGKLTNRAWEPGNPSKGDGFKNSKKRSRKGIGWLRKEAGPSLVVQQVPSGDGVEFQPLPQRDGDAAGRYR